MRDFFAPFHSICKHTHFEGDTVSADVAAVEVDVVVVVKAFDTIRKFNCILDVVLMY